MHKELLDALEIVMEELSDRLPESSRQGYMPTKDVVDAIKFVNREIKLQKEFNKKLGRKSNER